MGDKKKNEEEKLARQQELEEEELRKAPYEEEMILCDYLINYLSRTYLTNKKNEAVFLKDGPFSGIKPIKNKSSDVFFRSSKEKKKNRSRTSKRRTPTILSLNFDSFEQFGLLNLTPPRSNDMVDRSIMELREKKKWFSEQTHGAVPTIREIRKNNQIATSKTHKIQDPSPSSLVSGSRGNLTGTITGDDFVPLSSKVSPVTFFKTSWAQKLPEDEQFNDSKQ